MLLAIFVLFAVVLRLLTATILPKVRFPVPAFRVKSVVKPLIVLPKFKLLLVELKVLGLLPVRVTPPLNC